MAIDTLLTAEVGNKLNFELTNGRKFDEYFVIASDTDEVRISLDSSSTDLTDGAIIVPYSAIAKVTKPKV